MNGISTAQTSPLAASGKAEINETAGAKFHTAMELFWTRRAHLILLIVIGSLHRLVWIFLAYLPFIRDRNLAWTDFRSADIPCLVYHNQKLSSTDFKSL
jgi:hypothetical protein